MSNLPPNPFNSVSGAPQVNANPAVPVYNHFQQFSQVPSNQLPPGYTGLKQDANSNSPLHAPTSVQQNSALHNVNHYNQSSSSSPAFNQPGMIPPSPQNVLQSSPMKPPISMVPPKNPLPSNPLTSGSPRPLNANPSPNNFASNFPPQHNQINDNTPPLVPTSQFNQPLVNGPPTSSQTAPPGVYNTPPIPNKPFNTGPTPLDTSFGPPPVSNLMPSGTITSQPTIPYSSALTGPPRNSPLMQGPPVSQFNSAPVSGPPLSQALTNGPPLGPQRPMGTSGPPMSGPQIGPPTQKLGPIGSTLGPQGPTLSRMPLGPATSGPPLGPSRGPGLPPPPSLNGPPIGQSPYSGPPRNGPSGPMSTPGPPSGPPSGPQSLPPHFAPMGPPTINQGLPIMNQGPPTINQLPPTINQGPPIMTQGPPTMNQGPPIMKQGPPTINQGSPIMNQGPPTMNQGPNTMNQGPPTMNQGPPTMSQGPPIMKQGPPTINQGPPIMNQGPPSMNQGPNTMDQGPPIMNQGPPTMNQGPLIMNQQGPSVMNQQGPPKSNMQGRYPQMPPSGYNQPPQPGAPNMGNQQYPQPYNAQAMTQQMGQLSVTKQGFDQLWGHHMVDLLQCRHVLPEYPEDPPEIKLGHQFADAANCSPEIFRCTINRIPESNSLLQKSRLPLGILIHPFKDINHLPVIQCNTIVRCRACRTYINPFVYFVDAKRWKCNLCYRVNDLPDEFQYDPVSKSYGDPSRRPEIKSATIEFIAPGEYMLRPPQPAVYLFLLDVSQLARDSGYLQVVCSSLQASLEQAPGDARTAVGFLCYDVHVHYYLMSEGLTRPKECTVLDVDDVFLPSPDSLLVNLGERRELVRELLTVLPQRFAQPGVPGSALGAALQAAYKLMAPTGGRITVFQTCLPNVGPGALQPREDPNARSSTDVAHLNPATDFYKRLALDCCGAQVAVDLFLLNSQYSDLATLSGMSKFSGGSVYHIPLFKASRKHHAEQLDRMLNRYLTRKIGFEAVMRVRCTRGISIHTFHGNFFVRSTDLLSLPNVSPDAGFAMQLAIEESLADLQQVCFQAALLYTSSKGITTHTWNMQLAIEESLADLQQVCFQAALLYTSSKGERRIRVHTLALPIANTLPDVLHAADQQCIIGLLSKMAVDRALSASLGEAREALMHVAVEALGAHRLAHNLPAAGAGLLAPATLRLLPLLLLATLKRKAFRTGTSTRLDDRVYDMCAVKAAPLAALLAGTYPALYAVHELPAHSARTDSGELVPDPPHMHLTAERVNSTGAYLLDDGESMVLYVCCNVSPAFLSDTFGVAAFHQLPDEMRDLPKLNSPGNTLLHSFIERLNDERPYPSDLLILRDNSPSRQLFTERLVDDRVESAFSYYEFLQHIKNQVK